MGKRHVKMINKISFRNNNKHIDIKKKFEKLNYISPFFFICYNGIFSKLQNIFKFYTILVSELSGRRYIIIIFSRILSIFYTSIFSLIKIIRVC